MFPTVPEGDLELCNGQPGSALAAWLKEELGACGFACDDLIQEDYGWGFWIMSKEQTIWVSVSFAPGESCAEPAGNACPDPEAGEWYIGATHEVPFLLFQPWKWGQAKIGKAEQERIYKKMKEAVEANQEKMTILREEPE